MMSRVLLRVGALGLAAATVPGVPNSVGFLSSWSRIATALDNRTGHSGGATRYSIMLQGCCDWDSYNLTAPMQLHAEIEPTALGKDFELDFTYDKLYDFFGGAAEGAIKWWWAEATRGVAFCITGVGADLVLKECDREDPRQIFAWEEAPAGGRALVHESSGACVEQPASSAFYCSGKASSGCEFLQGPLALAPCAYAPPGRSPPQPAPAQLWDAPARPEGLDAALAAIVGGPSY